MSEPETPAERPGDPVLTRPPSGDGDGEGSVEVVGTAHVSQESVEEVQRVIEDRRPDVVAVELDEGRYRQMQGDAPEDLEPADLLEGNTVFQFLAYWMLSYVQTRMGERFDIEPGAEMKAAIESAEAAGSGVALVDRDIQVTIQRFWARMTFLEKIKTVSGLAFGAASPGTVAATTALVMGIFLGPLIALASAFGFGIPAATMSQIAVGGLAGAVAGYVGYELGRGVGGVDAGVAVGIVAALASAGAVVGAGVGGGLVDGMMAFLLGGITIGATFGLAVGVLVGLWLGSGEDPEELEDAIDIEDLTDADVVTAMMEEFRRFSPGGAEALIDERDAYIAHHLVGLRQQGYDVVAVVGAGHREGIQSYLDRPETLPAFESLVGRESGSRFSLYKVFGYLISVGFLVFFALLVIGGASGDFLLELFVAWFLFNGILAFGLAKLAGARWISAAVGGGVAWLTSVNPLLAPGWFAGYVELKYTTVNVADISRLNEILKDEESPVRDLVSRMFDVPLFRLIMIVAMTNFGSMIATFAFPFVVLPLVAPEGDPAIVGEILVRGVDVVLRFLRGLL